MNLSSHTEARKWNIAMTLDELCQVLRNSGLITAIIVDEEHEKFLLYFLGSAKQKACLARPDVLEALKKHRGELWLLVRNNDIAVCMAPDADRASYRYIAAPEFGDPYFCCDACAHLREKFAVVYGFLPRDPILNHLELPE